MDWVEQKHHSEHMRYFVVIPKKKICRSCSDQLLTLLVTELEIKSMFMLIGHSRTHAYFFSKCPKKKRKELTAENAIPSSHSFIAAAFTVKNLPGLQCSILVCKFWTCVFYCCVIDAVFFWWNFSGSMCI